MSFNAWRLHFAKSSLSQSLHPLALSRALKSNVIISYFDGGLSCLKPAGTWRIATRIKTHLFSRNVLQHKASVEFSSWGENYTSKASTFPRQTVDKAFRWKFCGEIPSKKALPRTNCGETRRRSFQSHVLISFPNKLSKVSRQLRRNLSTEALSTSSDKLRRFQEHFLMKNYFWGKQKKFLFRVLKYFPSEGIRRSTAAEKLKP